MLQAIVLLLNACKSCGYVWLWYIAEAVSRTKQILRFLPELVGLRFSVPGIFSWVPAAFRNNLLVVRKSGGSGG